MSLETRHTLIFIIDSFYTQGEIGGSDQWSKINLYRVLQYVPLDRVSKVQGSYCTAKQNPKVVLDPEEEEDPPRDAPQD